MATNLTLWLCLAYLLAHSLMVLLGRERPGKLARILFVNLGWSACFLGGLLLDPPFWFLWLPVLFFWWAYRWSSHTLGAIHPADFSLDLKIIAWEERFLGQPSLWWARRGSPWITEIFHIFYFTYYLYTPVIGIYLCVEDRVREFEAMTFAVLLGYAVCYILFAVTPAVGPRWALVSAGLLDPSEQHLKGYWFTRIILFIMYRGVALKGGALPSAHSSTAVVFLAWCWKLWGLWGGVPALVIVAGMWIGSVYGRYHYVFDILLGALLGIACVALAQVLIPG